MIWLKTKRLNPIHNLFTTFAKMSKDEGFIQRCIELAKLGAGMVSPNPMVGAVVVHDNRIIGEGYHRNYGAAHAEVNAINNVKDPALLPFSTLYVNLEPCAHFGKTPPCADLIIKSKIPKVVIGCRDSFSKVNGKGIEKLRNAGLDVIVGVLENECIALNQYFFTYHNKKRPYIILKWAQSLDGFIDKIRAPGEKRINWITKPETQLITHRWRSETDAILVGKNTVTNDNPSLTVRAVSGKNPVRLVWDNQLELNNTFHVFDNSSPTIIINKIKSDLNFSRNSFNISYLKAENIKGLLTTLFELNITSLLVEGGSYTHHSFLQENMWDEVRMLTGKRLFLDGIKAPTVTKEIHQKIILGDDTLTIFKNA